MSPVEDLVREESFVCSKDIDSLTVVGTSMDFFRCGRVQLFLNGVLIKSAAGECEAMISGSVRKLRNLPSASLMKIISLNMLVSFIAIGDSERDMPEASLIRSVVMDSWITTAQKVCLNYSVDMHG